jgi:xanthine dehydrogenase YagS FAD-binding subunit
MHNFEYANPKTVKEAAALLGSNWADAAVLAGGTDLISAMKDGVVAPKRLVNIKNVKELGGISKAAGGLRIGAAATFDELMNNSAVRSDYAALMQAARGVASPQIRNMGTVGGDLLQRPRCWYFRNGFGLLAMKDGKSMVPDGENRYHAIFATGPAYFVSASSLGPALVALGAKVRLVSAGGSREIAVSELFVAPTDANTRETSIKPNEILTEIIVPAAAGARSATYEIREREALDWPLVTASVALRKDGASIVLGHVAPTPYVAADAGKLVAGKSITEQLAEQAGAAAVAGAKPLSQNAYKVQLAKVAVKRALLTASGKQV